MASMDLSAQQRRAALLLQQRLELTPMETVRLVLSHPHILDYQYNRNLEPALDVLQAMLGLSQVELAKVMRACPQVLPLCQHEALPDRLLGLRDVLRLDSSPALGRLVVKFPRLLTLSVDENVRPTMAALQSLLRLSDEEACHLVFRHPQVLSLRVEDNAVPTLAVLQERLALDREQLRALILRMPTALGLSAEANLRPKLDFLAESLEMPQAELRDAVLRNPLVLGASLQKALRPNVAAWSGALPAGISLQQVVAKSGLRFLTSAYETRTRPRLERVAQEGIDAVDLVSQMRSTDEKFEEWIRARAAPSSYLEVLELGS